MIAEKDLNATAKDRQYFITAGLCACKLVFLSPQYSFVMLVTHNELNKYKSGKIVTVGIKIKQQQCHCGIKNYNNLHLQLYKSCCV